MSSRTVAIATATTVVTTTLTLWLLHRRRQWNSPSQREARRALEDSTIASLAGPNPLFVSATTTTTPITTGAETTTTTSGNEDKLQMLTTLYIGNSNNSSQVASGTKVTLVFVHGFGCTSLEFAALRQELQQQLPNHVDIFAYDRILFVKEQPQGSRRHPRDATTLAEELHCLLQNRGIATPLVLIGHSYGGLVAQHYAHAHPHQVAGMVLLDPAHEEQFQQFPRDFAMSFTMIVPVILRMYQSIAWTGILQWLDRWGLFQFPPIFLLDKHQQELRCACAKLYSSGQVWKRVADELQGCCDTFDCMNAANATATATATKNNAEAVDIRRAFINSQMPLALVLANDRRYSPTLFPKAVTRAFLDMHRSLYQDDNDHDHEHDKSGPVGKLFLASRSDHWIHMQQPKVVVQAVQYVLQMIQEQQQQEQ